MNQEQPKYVVAFGYLSDGIQLVGPFDTTSEAVDYADGYSSGWGGNWEILKLENPDANGT